MKRTAHTAIAPGRLLGVFAAMVALSCSSGGADDGEATGDGQAGSAGAGRRSPAGDVLAGDVLGQGLLQALDPQFPERPLFRDFGELTFGEELVWAPRFRNVGDGPLQILGAQAACGCTRLYELKITPPDGREPIVIHRFEQGKIATVPAGAEVEVSIKLLTRYSDPNKRKLAIFRLTTDSVHEPYTTLEVGFLPTRPFIFAPREAKLLQVPTSHGGKARIKVLVDRTGNPARVLDVDSVPAGVDVELVTETFGGEYVWYVDVSLPPMSPLGVIRGDIVLRTTDREGNGDGGRLALPLLTQVVADAVLETPLVALGAVKSSEGRLYATRLTALVPGAKLGVIEARIESVDASDLSVVVRPVEPDERGRAKIWEVDVRVAPGRTPGFVSGDVVFVLDEPIGGTRDSDTGTELRVRLSGQVTED